VQAPPLSLSSAAGRNQAATAANIREDGRALWREREETRSEILTRKAIEFNKLQKWQRSRRAMRLQFPSIYTTIVVKQAKLNLSYPRRILFASALHSRLSGSRSRSRRRSKQQQQQQQQQQPPQVALSVLVVLVVLVPVPVVLVPVPAVPHHSGTTLSCC
jgi:hypothetical protein